MSRDLGSAAPTFGDEADIRPSDVRDDHPLQVRWEAVMTDQEIGRLAAEMIAGTLMALQKQAEVNSLSYLATLLGRAPKEALEQSRA